MATRPRAAGSWATTVTPGRSRSASSKSSKPTSATGRGSAARTRTTVTVTRLLPAKTAVTGSGPASIAPAAAATRSGAVAPRETQDPDTGRPARAIASR